MFRQPLLDRGWQQQQLVGLIRAEGFHVPQYPHPVSPRQRFDDYSDRLLAPSTLSTTPWGPIALAPILREAALRASVPVGASHLTWTPPRTSPPGIPMKTQHTESPPGAGPLAPVRALCSIAERLLDHATGQVERWESMPGPAWLERDLAECEKFIREASSASGLGLDYEGGRQLAEAKIARRELRRLHEEAVSPYRRSAALWRGLRTRLALALKKSRGPGAQPQHLRALLALVEELGRPLADQDTQTLKEARACIRQLEVDPDARRPRKIGAYAVSSGPGGGAETAPFSPPAPNDVELDPALLNR